jgi:hypothetical protein
MQYEQSCLNDDWRLKPKIVVFDDKILNNRRMSKMSDAKKKSWE